MSCEFYFLNTYTHIPLPPLFRCFHGDVTAALTTTVTLVLLIAFLPRLFFFVLWDLTQGLTLAKASYFSVPFFSIFAQGHPDRSSYLHLPHSGMTGTHHHSQLFVEMGSC
jgi:hypothetical protein